MIWFWRFSRYVRDQTVITHIIVPYRIYIPSIALANGI
jgi:hypothetical protein